MNQRYQRGFPKGNPLSNALVLIAGALAMAASLVLGFFVFTTGLLECWTLKL